MNVRDLTEIDIAPAARALGDAFFDDPMQIYVLPDPEERAARSPGQFERLLRFGMLFGTATTSAGEIRGACITQPPGADMTSERAIEAGVHEFGDVLGAEAFGRLGSCFEYLEANHRARVPLPHWYVMVLGTERASHGRGVGSALLSDVAARADAAEVPLMLDTCTGRNVGFYRGHAFEVTDESVDPASGLRWWTMVRDVARD